MGSTYFQNKKFLTHLDELRWSIVEQPAFVKCGREFFQDDTLTFFFSIDECLQQNDARAILLSSVLPYVEKPHQLLDSIIKHRFQYIIIDRTPLIKQRTDRLTIQKVPPSIYNANYPAWFFSRDGLLSAFEKEYELIADFDALGGKILIEGGVATDKGFIFKLKGSVLQSE